MDISKNGFITRIDASNVIFKDNTDTANPTSKKISYDHENDILKFPGNVVVTNPVLNNNTYIVNIDLDKFVFIGIGNQDDINIKINTGETITFDLTRTENDGDQMIITNENVNTTDSIATNDNNVIEYYLNNVKQASYSDFNTNFVATPSHTQRSIVFKPQKGGTYFCKSSTNNNISMILTVTDLHSNKKENNDDISFNKNLDVCNNLVVKGDTSLQDTTCANISVSNKLDVMEDASFNRNVQVDGDISLNKEVDILQNLKIVGTLTVESETSLKDDVSMTKNLLVNDTITTNNIPIVHRSFDVKVDNQIFFLNDISGYELCPVIKVGESILLKQDDGTNVIDSTNKHPLYVSTHHTNDVLFEASQNNIIEYTVNDVKYDNVLLYETALTNSTTRSVLFKPQVEGTYFYHNKNANNYGGRITVIKNDNILKHINNDLSLNNNSINLDFSANFVAGERKRIRMVFHPDY